jgi:aquaporin Z
LDLSKKLLAEFIGPFALVFVGSLSVDISGSLVGVAIAHGFTLMFMVLAIGAVSGCHINPAITIAYLSVKKIPAVEAAGYIIVQLTAAVVAGFLHLWITPDSTTFIGLPLPSAAIGGSAMMALAIEAIFTSILAFSVYITAVHRKASPGFAALNPARAFGPAIASGNLTTLWLYFVGPIIGAVVGFYAAKTLD